jgi:leader peptidase (prepilin peptidase) / N-methyltransferase
MTLEAILAFFAGLLIGSFLNVCIFRLPHDLSVVMPRSFCPHCEHPIRWYDNIPLASFFVLRGRCRDCNGPIPLRYPIVELLTATMFALAISRLGVTWAGFKLCLFAAILIELVFSDLEERILPDEFTLGGAAAGVALAALVPLPFGLLTLILDGEGWMYRVLDSLFAAVVCSGSLWLIGAVYQRVRGREGIGPGDVKMVAMIGAFLGLQGALLTMMIGSVLGSLVGLAFIFFTGKNASTYELPFGTFLGAAALLVAIVGEFILTYYRQLG